MFHWINKLLFWRKAPPPPAVLFPFPEVLPEPEPPAPEPEPPPPEPVKEFPICEGCGRHYDPRIRDRMKRRKLARARIQTADAINDILQRLHSLDLRHGHKIGAASEMRALDQLMACDFYMFDSNVTSHEALSPGDKWGCFPADDRNTVEDLADVCWPIDQATATHYLVSSSGEPENYLLQRVRTVTPEEARGFAHTFVPKMVRHSYVKFFMDGTWYTDDNFAGLINGRWTLLDRRMGHRTKRAGWTIVHRMVNDEITRREAHQSVAMQLSLALTRRYSWHVALGTTVDGPRILLPTNPAGCLQFFQNRDRDEGRARRAALRHWVMRHYRERSDSGVAYVRNHLRGNTEFRWSDLECEIFVSAYDLEKNEEFKREAALWRSQRKHNSVKVRLKRKIA